MLDLYKNLKTRFLIAGIVNSAASYSIYWLLLSWLDYRIAYTIAYISGIILAYFLNTQMVFSRRMTVRSLFIYPLVYFSCYLFGSLVLVFFVQLLGIQQKLAMLLTMITVVPVSFFLNRLFFQTMEK